MIRWAARLSVTLVLGACAPAIAAAPADPFDACRQQFRAKPQEYDSAYCFYTVSQRPGLWADGKRVFENLIREDPANLWLSLVYGHVLRDREPDAAEAQYRRAAEGFKAARHAEGEFLARSSLRNFLSPKGRVDEANAQMDRIAELSSSIDDPVLKAQIWIVQASHIQDRGGDLGVAYRLLKQAERALFPVGPYRQQRTCLTWLGLIAFRMGRHDEALELFKSLDALAGREGDLQTRAVAQYNLLNTWSLKESLLPSAGARQRLLDLAQQTLALAHAVQNQQVVLKTRRTIAALMANNPTYRDAALRHLEDCVELASTMRQPADEAACAWLQASVLQATDPARARSAQVRALRATERANAPLADAYSASRHMQFGWQSKPRSEAIRDSVAAIDAIETLRSLQEDGESSAELFSNWTLEYYWLSGRLLETKADADLEVAFSITERMRARSLLDALNRSRLRADPALPAVVTRRSLLTDIARLQRTLMDPTLPSEARRSGLGTLADLEFRARETERQIALTLRAQTARPSFATLDALQSALGKDEALLSFQVGIWETYEGDFGGGSWLLALTADDRSVYRIPDRTHFAPIVPVYAGLLAREGGATDAAAVRLYGDVFAGALERLPPGTRRLIVIPDGPLQQLPLETLRSAAGAPPLAARYEMVVAPSATLWLQWREHQAQPSQRSALVFADPELAQSAQSDAPTRMGTLHQGLRFGRLPHARRESRAIERHLGAVDALVGREASEMALKARDPQQYALLHFAAHAVSDEVRPERSAVLLSAGGEGEDGLLQAREIQHLDLRGRIVILSACETASGAVLNGEGVLSLARAFFQAGARAVVGTRWRIRDEDGAELFDAFYEHLADGASLSQALARTKRDAIARGRPADAWGSLILLGDGAATPFAAATKSSPIDRGLLMWAFLAVALLLCALAFTRVRESLYR
jgi:tetratricopeptide (TPR) repeat protein